MKGYETSTNRNLASIVEAKVKAELTIETLRVKEVNYLNTLNTLSFSRLNKCFDKLKLDAVVRGIHQPGESIADFNKEDIWIEIIAVPLLESSVKPIVHKGYTSRGASVNEKQRKEKARKLEAKITELTGYKCNINEYSLEVKHIGENVNIMINLTIPNSKTLNTI